MPVTSDTLRRYRQGDVFVETGCLYGDGIQAALEAGFSQVFSIELEAALAYKARRRFAGKSVQVLHGDTVLVLPQVLRSVGAPATFWLDAHAYYSTPLLLELAVIAAHHVKTHTILIDDRRLMGTDWPDVTEAMVVSALKVINDAYEISYADGYIENDIIVARGPQ